MDYGLLKLYTLWYNLNASLKRLFCLKFRLEISSKKHLTS